MPRQRSPRSWLPLVRILLFLFLLAVAIVRIFVPSAERIDATFLSIVGLGLVLLAIPWEKIQWQHLGSFKALGVEISVTQPQVKGALESLKDPQGLPLTSRLREALQDVTADLEKVVGSRVLWVDDHPNTVLGERRLLRAIGIDVVQVASSDEASSLLVRDADFHLLITDIQRKGESHERLAELHIEATPMHEGANFIAGWLRPHDDRFISHLPVLFYAAYPWDRLVQFTREAVASAHRKDQVVEKSASPSIILTDMCNSPDELLRKAVRMLAWERTHPVEVQIKEQKTPT